ncbi:uncharacterized protein LOC120443440 [Oreochromis aureus]|uniref:uncharacterized protein LOC120443440 n=1 Tax=Oreochromis aureus TaxID=47969 RepID=UPI001954514E|nr:uncharacterized protein LOC120443440 [Oreochromis aureus]
MGDLIEFLKQREVSEEIIQTLENEKIDASVISLMTDEELKTYLPSYGDRLAVFGFCRRRGSSRKSALFERLKSKLSKRKLSEEDGSSTRQEEHSQTTHKRNALKRNRKIEIGWMHYDEDTEVFKQVRARRGGGTRKIDICKDAKKRDILQVATGLFFPDGGNIQGPLTDFDCDLKDYQEMIVDDALTVGELYHVTKLNILRFYLTTKKNKMTAFRVPAQVCIHLQKLKRVLKTKPLLLLSLQSKHLLHLKQSAMMCHTLKTLQTITFHNLPRSL